MRIKNVILISILSLLMFCGCAAAVDNYDRIFFKFNDSVEVDDVDIAVWQSSSGVSYSNIYPYDGGYAVFNASAAPAIVTNSRNLNPRGDNFSISFALNLSSVGVSQYILGSRQDGYTAANTPITIYVTTNGTLTMALGNGTSSTIIYSNYIIPTHEWHSYTINRVGNNITMYRDETTLLRTYTLSDNYALFANDTVTLWTLGRNGATYSQYLNGSLDNFNLRVYNNTRPDVSRHHFAFGDSVTMAKYTSDLSDDGSDCYILQMIQDHDLYSDADHNMDGGGQNSSWGIANFDKYYNSGYDIFYLAFGLNDLADNDSAQDLCDNLILMHNWVESNGSKCVVLVQPVMVENESYWYKNYTTQVNYINDVQDILDENNIKYIKLYDALDQNPGNGLPDLANSSYYAVDGVHPNRAGHALMGNTIWSSYINVSNSYIYSSVPAKVQFFDVSGLNNSISWEWDFENNGIVDSTQRNPTYMYGIAGNYSVNLTVQNEYGNFSTIKTDYITVEPANLTNVTLEVNDLTHDDYAVTNGMIGFKKDNAWSNFTIQPDNPINVTVDRWDVAGDYRKVWNESSEIANTVTVHQITGFPANTFIDIYRDGSIYESVVSNSSGCIMWSYSGGYSEHTFEIQLSTSTEGIRESFVSSWSNTVSMIGVIILVSLAGSMIMMLRGKKDMSSVMTDMQGILIVVVLVILGAVIFGQF